MKASHIGILCLLLCTQWSCATAPASNANAAQAYPSTQLFSADSYPISPSDTIRVDIYGEGDLSGKYIVEPAGTVNLPLVGRLSVAGLTVNNAEVKLARLLANGYIVDPDVRITIVSYRPVFVSGEVNQPGKYPFTPGMTVQQAIVLAGGPTRFAARKYYRQRSSASGVSNVRVEGSAYLQPGDIITVDERLF